MSSVVNDYFSLRVFNPHNSKNRHMLAFSLFFFTYYSLCSLSHLFCLIFVFLACEGKKDMQENKKNLCTGESNLIRKQKFYEFYFKKCVPFSAFSRTIFQSKSTQNLRFYLYMFFGSPGQSRIPRVHTVKKTEREKS